MHNEIEQAVSSLGPKLLEFAKTLDPDERDVLEAIVTVAANQQAVAAAGADSIPYTVNRQPDPYLVYQKMDPYTVNEQADIGGHLDVGGSNAYSVNARLDGMGSIVSLLPTR